MINTDFYGENYYSVPNTPFKLANFRNDNPSVLNSSILQYAIDNERYEAGTLLDNSIAPYGIPTLKDGQHTYNTLFDYGVINKFFNSENCIKGSTANNLTSIPMIYRQRLRTSGSDTTSCMFNINDTLVLNAPARSGTWDLYRLQPVVSCDFTKFIFCIVVICFDGDVENGTITRQNIMDLYTYCHDGKFFDSGTKTAREYYPYISQIFVAPAFCSTWNNFTSAYFTTDYNFGVFPNVLYNMTCAKDDNTNENFETPVIYNAVSYMENVPLSGASIIYTMANDTQINTLGVSSELCGAMLLLGMLGGNGTSWGITSSVQTNYGFLHGVKGFKHCKIVGNGTNYFSYWFDMPDNVNDIKHAIHKMCSYLGAIFCDKIDGDLTNIPKYIGILNENSIATGTYEKITDSDFDKYAQTKTDDFIANTDYEPTGTTDNNVYTDTMISDTAPIIKSVNKYYAMNVENISILYHALLDTLSGVPSGELEEYLLNHFMTNSPIDLLQNLKYYPFNTAELFFDTSDTPKTIFVGDLPLSYDGSNVVGYKARLNSEYSKTFTIGSFNYFRHFNDFRDYEPYSGLDIYIPFCSVINIKPSIAMGHNIYVQISVDILSGGCTGIVRLDYDNGIIIGTSSGNVGVEMPLSGAEQSIYNNSIFNAIQQQKQAQITIKSQTLNTYRNLTSESYTMENAGNLIGMGLENKYKLESAYNAKIAADYNLSHTEIPYHNITANTSLLSMLQPLHTYAIITRPIMLDSFNENYKHTTGYVTIENDTLSNYSGLTVCSSVDLSNIPATETEKELLRTAFTTGVYL